MENKFKDVKLSTKNLFRVVRIVDKTGILTDIKDIFKRAYSEESAESAQEAVGYEIFDVVIKCLEKSEDELYELIADIEGKTVEEVQEQDFMSTVETITSIVMDKRIRDFLKKVRG